jgi:hypothetical protein
MSLATRKALIVVAATVAFILSLWLLGFGFGHELRLSRWLGRPFLGSTVYFGTWFIFLATLVLGSRISYIVARFVLHQPQHLARNGSPLDAQRFPGCGDHMRRRASWWLLIRIGRGWSMPDLSRRRTAPGNCAEPPQTL